MAFDWGGVFFSFLFLASCFCEQTHSRWGAERVPSVIRHYPFPFQSPGECAVQDGSHALMPEHIPGISLEMFQCEPRSVGGEGQRFSMQRWIVFQGSSTEAVIMENLINCTPITIIFKPVLVFWKFLSSWAMRSLLTHSICPFCKLGFT